MSEASSRAVERALSIMETVGASHHSLSHSDLCRRLGIPKGTASYLLHTLEARGYLHREPETGRYSLGLQVLQLSHGVSAHLDLRTAALPHLRQFVAEMNLPAHLATLEQGRVVYIEKVESTGFVRMATWVGKRLPVHTTAVGKALVAWLSAEQVAAILQQRGMEPVTPETIVTQPLFLRELEKVRRQRYALDLEENNLGVRCVAAPVLNDAGDVVAALGTSGTTAQIADAHLQRVINAVQASAQTVSQALGYA